MPASSRPHRPPLPAAAGGALKSPRGGLSSLQRQRERLCDELFSLRTRQRALQERCRRPPGKRRRQEKTDAVAEVLRRAAGPGEAEAVCQEFRAMALRTPRGGLPGEAAGAEHSRRPAEAAAVGGAARAPTAAEPPLRQAARQAEVFRRERSLTQWVKTMNTESALAPTSAQVWHHWRLALGAPLVPARAAAGAAAKPPKNWRQWLRRWRRRWGVRRRCIPAGPALQQTALREKAPPVQPNKGTPKTKTRARPVKKKGASFWTAPLLWGQAAGPFSRPKNGHHFWRVFLFPLGARRQEAEAVFRWNEFLESKCPAGKTVLRINMDETSVKLWVGGGTGSVAPPSAVAPALPFCCRK